MLFRTKVANDLRRVAYVFKSWSTAKLRQHSRGVVCALTLRCVISQESPTHGANAVYWLRVVNINMNSKDQTFLEDENVYNRAYPNRLKGLNLP